MKTLSTVAALLVLAGCGSSARQTEEQPQPVDQAKPADAPQAANLDDPDAALAEMEAASNRQKEEAARREQESEAEARRRAENEMREKEDARKKMEAERKGLEGIGIREGSGEDKPLFEERFAAEINKVRVELQKYKRW